MRCSFKPVRSLWSLASGRRALANWRMAPEAGKESAHTIAQAFSGVGFGRGFFPLEVVEIWMAIALTGIGMIQSRIYPWWRGSVGLVQGLVGVPLGIAETFTGREASLNIFKSLLVPTTFWFLAVGIWVARRAWRRGRDTVRAHPEKPGTRVVRRLILLPAKENEMGGLSAPVDTSIALNGAVRRWAANVPGRRVTRSPEPRARRPYLGCDLGALIPPEWRDRLRACRGPSP